MPFQNSGMNWGGVLSGAMGGAAAGAPLGPVGILGGAAIGAFAGQGQGGNGGRYQYDPNQDNFMLPGYSQTRDQYGNLISQGPRNAPQAGMSNFRGDQRQLSNMLMSQAQGHGPGQEIARMQAGQMADRGVGQQLAGARSAMPGQSAMAARNAAMASGQIQGQGAQAATMGGLQAQQQAVGQLGGVLQGARGQDLQRNLSNANLQLQQMGLDDRRQLELLAQRLQADRYQQMGGMGYEGALATRAGLEQKMPTDWERFLGSAQGMGQAYLQTKAGSR